MAAKNSIDDPGRDLPRNWQLALPCLSGIVMPFAFPPFSVPLVPFVGLVPLLLYFTRPRRIGDVAAASAAFAVPFFLGTTYWLFLLGRFTPAGFLGGFGVQLLQFGTFLFFPVSLNVLRHTTRIPLALAAPVLWTVSEHVRNFGDLEFPWASLGYALADWPALMQHADLVGVHGVSFWLVAVNALIAWAAIPRARAIPRILSLAAAFVLAAAGWGYGSWRTGTVRARVEAAPTVRVAVLQPNVPQSLKWNPTARREMLGKVVRMIDLGERHEPDLVLGPEAALPIITTDRDDRLPDPIPPGSRPLLLGMVRGRGSPEEVRLPDGRRTLRFRTHFNSALLVGPDRTVLGAYDKNHLVAVTEQIPYRRVFGLFLPLLRKQFGRFEPGDRLEILEVPVGRRSIRVGITVCYESLFPDHSRSLARRGAELFANVTNDAWFGRSSMSPQHVGLLVFRAVENRRAVVRSANTGISAWIDPLGRVRDRTRFEEEAVFVAEPHLLRGTTVYTRIGDLPVQACYAGALVMLILAWRRRPRGGGS